MLAPSPTLLDSYLNSPTVIATRRVDIFESDEMTPWMLNAPVREGSVSVDQARAERRAFDLILDNENGTMAHYPEGFWYDKVVKVHRGFISDEGSYETQIGTFVIDNISSGTDSSGVRCSGRDFTKKCLTSKFAYSTTFTSGSSVETTIRNIALNAGINKFVFPADGKTLGRDFTFDRGVERWAAMTEIATAYGYELYFDAAAYLILREPADPVTSPTTFTFKTGPDGGTLATFSKSTSDTRIYNHIVVVGERQDQLPITAEAFNNEPSSPTRIAKLGDRVYQYVSSFISTQDQAQDVADKFLKIHALEQFELSLGSLVIPWLEAGDIVEFDDPSPSPGDPFRFLLSSFNIPLALGTMTSSAKRVTIVG